MPPVEPDLRSAARAPGGPAAPVALLVVALGYTARLVDCLRALSAHASRVETQLVCVVNPVERPDEAARRAEVRALGISPIEPAMNLGWAGGLHRARAETEAPLLVWVQDDMLVQPGWLDALVDAAAEHPEVGVFGSVQVDATGAVHGFNGGWCAPPDLAAWAATDDSARRRPRGVERRDWVTSSGLMVRAAAWDDIGGPDPALYPLGYVDLDLCTHLRTHGWEVALVGEATIRHTTSQSTTGPLRAYLTERLGARVLERWQSVVAALPAGAAAAVEHACTAGRADALEQHCAREAAEVMIGLDRWVHNHEREASNVEAARAAERRAVDEGFATAIQQAHTLRAEVDDLRAELHAMRSTASWRLTAPLRALRRLMPGGRPAEQAEL